MFSCPKILFLVSLLFVALLNPKFNTYLLFKFLIFYHSSSIYVRKDIKIQQQGVFNNSTSGGLGYFCKSIVANLL